MDADALLQQGPQNREQLVEALGRLRVEGAIDEAEETQLLRHYDELQAEYQQALARAEPEYRRRVQADGQDAADRWLAETATELGRRAGEATRRLTDQLRVVTG